MESINGWLRVYQNSVLTNFSGLENLDAIGGKLVIGYNPLLNSLTGLDSIEAESIVDLIISDNDNLSDCAIYSICEYLSAPGGTVKIENNASGCNSPGEVDAACTNSVIESMICNGLKIHPNPFTTSTTIEYKLKQPSTVKLSVFNQLGQLVHQQLEDQSQGNQKLQWDAQNQPEGMYYFTLQAGEHVSTGKMLLVK